MRIMLSTFVVSLSSLTQKCLVYTRMQTLLKTRKKRKRYLEPDCFIIPENDAFFSSGKQISKRANSNKQTDKTKKERKELKNEKYK
jgi:hypothetical protein